VPVYTRDRYVPVHGVGLMTVMPASLTGHINVDLFCATWWRHHYFRISRVRSAIVDEEETASEADQACMSNDAIVMSNKLRVWHRC
jgi:hypothetical protein